MDLELALDDVRMATFRLGQETYGATPELAAAAAEAGANVLAGGLVLEFGHLFERIFLGD
jgi:hypothetical protein